jgi:nucleoside-diphosphate-sugar epimerase
VLPEHFALLEAHGAQRVAALSSTSRFTKGASSDPHEQAIAQRLEDAEAQVQAWAQCRGIEWTILRPTLIYGLGLDKNVSEIARVIQRFGFFPLLGAAQGLRQPVHVADVASACFKAVQAPSAANQAYNISGAEVLPYRAMVERIFIALRKPVHMLTVPLWFFAFAITMVRWLPRYRHWSSAMAERMNQDLVFDHTDAARDFGFKPRAFEMRAEDCPSVKQRS